MESFVRGDVEQGGVNRTPAMIGRKYLIERRFPYKLENMEITRKEVELREIGGDARRQYMDALSAFTEWERSMKGAGEVRGGMYWKKQGDKEYLVRTSSSNAQKSLGPRSPKTEEIYEKFVERKTSTEARTRDLASQLAMHKRLNRALFVGRAPQMLVDILAMLERAGIADYFTVVGTHALYAYEAAAGIRIESGAALATKDIDLLWDTRKRIQFDARMKLSGTSMLGMLKKVDPTFRIRPEQLHTAINSHGFEVDIIRREPKDRDPHPARITSDEEDFWVAQAERAGVLLASEPFSTMIVSPSGDMARMVTVSPLVFAKFKRWLSTQPSREPMKRDRDAIQADTVERIAEEYLPHLSRSGT